MISQLFDTTNGEALIAKEKFFLSVDGLAPGKWELVARKPKRTVKQNNAMWKFCRQIAAELNGVGAKHKTLSILDGRIVEFEWDEDLVKMNIWNPVQFGATGKKSSTKLTTVEIDKIAKPIIDLLAKEFHFGLLFPSQLSITLEKEAQEHSGSGSSGGKPQNSLD